MGTIKMVLGIAVMVATVYLIAELAPPYFANYQFQDSIETEAKLGTYSTKSEDNIREVIPFPRMLYRVYP